MRITKAVIKEVRYNNIVLAVLSDVRALRKLLVTLPTSLRDLARGVKDLTRSVANVVASVPVPIYCGRGGRSGTSVSSSYTSAVLSSSPLSSPPP